MMQPQKLNGQDVFKRLEQDSVFLNALEYTYLNEQIIVTPQVGNVLETAFPLKVSSNPFNTYHEYHKLDKYGSATESQVPGDADAITVDGTKVRVELPWYHADFVVNRVDLENSRLLGAPLDVSLGRAASLIVDNLFDEALYSRSSVFGTLGAYGLFTGTAVAAVNWATADPYEMFNDVVNFVKAIPAAYQSPNMRMLLDVTNYHELSRSNIYGLSARKLLAESYPQLQILVTKQATHGFGLIYPFRDDAVYLVIGMPKRAIEWEAKAWEGRFKTVRSGRLIVPAATAGVKFGGL